MCYKILKRKKENQGFIKAGTVFPVITGTAAIILIWIIAARLVGQEIILPTPKETIKALYSIIQNKFFWKSVYFTFWRGLAAFGVSLAAGILIGTAAGSKKSFNIFFKPFIILVRSTPVVSFILIALFWLSSSNVPILTAGLMSFPIICVNIIHGIQSIDKNLYEMTVLFNFTRISRIRHLILPSIYPFLLAGGSTGLGLSWKAVVAAEVLSSPQLGIGAGLQESRVYLDTSGVFAWTLIAVLLSAFADILFTILAKIRKIEQ